MNTEKQLKYALYFPPKDQYLSHFSNTGELVYDDSNFMTWEGEPEQIVIDILQKYMIIPEYSLVLVPIIEGDPNHLFAISFNAVANSIGIKWY